MSPACSVLSASISQGQGQNVAIAFVELKNMEARVGPEASAQAIVRRAMRGLAPIRDANVVTLNPPAIQGFGNSAGFRLLHFATTKMPVTRR